MPAHARYTPDNLLELVHPVWNPKILPKADHLAKICIFIYIGLHRRNKVITLAVGQKLLPLLMYAPHQRALKDHAQPRRLLCHAPAQHASLDHALWQLDPQSRLCTGNFHQFADGPHILCLELDQIRFSLAPEIYCTAQILWNRLFTEKYPRPDCPPLIRHRRNLYKINLVRQLIHTNDLLHIVVQKPLSLQQPAKKQLFS